MAVVIAENRRQAQIVKKRELNAISVLTGGFLAKLNKNK